MKSVAADATDMPRIAVQRMYTGLSRMDDLQIAVGLDMRVYVYQTMTQRGPLEQHDNKANNADRDHQGSSVREFHIEKFKRKGKHQCRHGGKPDILQVSEEENLVYAGAHELKRCEK